MFTHTNSVKLQRRTRRKAFLTIMLALLFCTQHAGAQTYVTNGSAYENSTNYYTLTPNAYGQGGSVWYQYKLDLRYNFSLDFDIYLGNNDGGADGVAFVLQPNSTGAGSTGGGLGYLGISPSLDVEFDTYQNTSDPWDDHIALVKNGDVYHYSSNNLQGPVVVSNMENGGWHDVKIYWDASNQNFKVYYDGSLKINYTSNIVSTIFSGNPYVYWGFTGATGGATNLQMFQINSSSFVQQLVAEVEKKDVSCNGASDGSATVTASGGTAPYTYSWSNGATTQTISGLAPGTYSVTVTDNANVTATQNITINEPSVLNFTATGHNVSCVGDDDGSVTLNATGGSSPYTFHNGLAYEDAFNGPINITNYSYNTMTATGTGSELSLLPNSGWNSSFLTNQTFTRQEGLTFEGSIFIPYSGYKAVMVGFNDGSGSGTPSVSNGIYFFDNGSTSPVSVSARGGNYANSMPVSSYSNSTSPGTWFDVKIVLHTNGATYHVKRSTESSYTNVVTYTWPVNPTTLKVGAIATTSSGVVATLHKNWRVYNPAQTEDLSPGTYTYYVTDASGCTKTATATIGEPTALSVSASVVNNVSCNGGNDGEVSLTPTGGTAPYTVQSANDFYADFSGTSLNSSLYEQNNVTLTQNGNLKVVPYSSYGWDSYVRTAQTFSRDVGKTFEAKIFMPSGNTGNYEYRNAMVGWNNGQTNDYSAMAHCFYFYTDYYGNYLYYSVREGYNHLYGYNTISTDTWYDIRIELTSNGAKYYLKPSSSSNWTLVYTSTNSAIYQNLKAGIVTYGYHNYAYNRQNEFLTDGWKVSGNGGGGSSTPTEGLTAGTHTFTIYDANGCSASTTATISEPTAITATYIVSNTCGNTGDLTLSASGGVAPYTYSVDGGNTFNSTHDFYSLAYGNYDVVVKDANGCEHSFSATVANTDVQAPVISCKPLTVELDANGIATVTPTMVDNGTTDDCNFTLSLSQTAFDCTNLGSNNVTLTATDVNGNASTCVAVVTVNDHIAPEARVKAIVVHLDGNGQVSIAPADINDGSSDACGITSMTIDKSDFTCAEIGQNSVTLTVSDASGNSSEATAIVEVQDNLAPIAIAQNITVQLDANGEAYITANQINNGSTDNCGIASLTLDKTQFDCSNFGQNNVILTVVDNSGNEASAAAVVTVEDNVAPNASVQNVTVQLDSTGNATIVEPATIIFAEDFSSDANGTYYSNTTITNWDILSGGIDVGGWVSGIPGREIDLSAFTNGGVTSKQAFTFTPGAYTLSFDHIRNSTDDPFTVSIGNIISQTFYSTASLKSEVISFTVTTTTSGKISFVQGGANDANGTFVGNIKLAKDAYLIIENGSTDNCGLASITASKTEFTCADAGQNTVTLTVTDVHGNTSTADATVTVEDNIAPSITCAADVNANTSGNVSITIPVSQSSFYGSGPSYSFSDPVPAGATITKTEVTYTVYYPYSCCVAANDIFVAGTHVGSRFPQAPAGNKTYTITYNGVLPGYNYGGNNSFQVNSWWNGVALRSASIKFYYSSGCQAQVSAGGPQAADNCGIASIVNDYNNTADASGIYPVGVTEVNWTVTDNSGNTNTCKQYVTVADEESPNISCKNTSVMLTADGTVTITAADVLNSATDNCAIDTIQLDKYTFGISDVGMNTVTLTVTDIHGNISTCQATVEVIDPLPVAICQNITIELDANGNASIQASDIDNGSHSVVGIGDMYLDKTDFTCDDYGQNQVVLTVENIFGSAATCTTTVTVTSPAVTVNISSPLYNGFNISCNGGANGSIDAVVAGGCIPYTYNWSNGATTEDVSKLPAGTYTLTVTDRYGKQASATITLTEPDAFTSSVTSAEYNGYNISCNGGSNGNIDLSVAGGVAPYTYSWSNSAVTEDLSGLAAGSYSVTVTDANGCTTTASITLTEPALLTSSVTSAEYNGYNISCNGGNNGNVDLTVAGGVAPYTYSWNNSASTEDLSGLSTGTYNVTVTDANGCTTTATITLTEPDALTSSVTSAEYNGYNISCNGGSNGNIDLSVAGGVAPYSYSWSNSASSEDLSGLTAGTYNVTATDANGCTTIASITLTEPSAISLSGVIADHNGNGHAISCNGYSDGEVDLTATGGVAPYSYSWSNSTSSEDLSGVAEGTYSVTVTDANGCSASMSFTLTQPDPLVVTLPPFADMCIYEQPLMLFGGIPMGGVYAGVGVNSGTGYFDPQAAGVGVHEIRYTYTDQYGCFATAATTITVHPRPTVAFTAPAPVCSNGAAVALQAYPVGGTFSGIGVNGDWFFAETAGVGTHTLVYTYTNPNTGCVNSDTQSILVRDIPVADAGADQTVYYGYSLMECATLSGSATGGSGSNTYEWSDGNSVISYNPTYVVCPTSTTTYTLTVTDAYGCTTTDNVTVHVADVRCGNKNDKVLMCHNGQEICISASAVASHLAHNGNASGKLTCFLGSCSGNKRALSSAEEELFEEEHAEEHKLTSMFTAYPNPFYTSTKVVFVTGQDEQVKMELLDMQGRSIDILFNGEAKQGARNEVMIDGTTLSSSVYFVRLTGEADTQYLRIVLSR